MAGRGIAEELHGHSLGRGQAPGPEGAAAMPVTLT